MSSWLNLMPIKTIKIQIGAGKEIESEILHGGTRQAIIKRATNPIK
jgi:hypothetical protein